jgi:F-type H+-transporting ATPase subunit b
LELNWSTFVLEIINFLVLVWILKRFLYQPVMDVIARRREAIDKKLDEARQLSDDASAMSEQYKNRLAEWEQERQKAKEKLTHELEEYRLAQLEKLKTELTQEEEKIHVSRSRQEKQALREVEQRALHQGAEFASRILSEATGPELDNRLLEILLHELTTLPEDQISTLRNNWGESPEQILITSAYPIAEDKRHQLESLVNKITAISVPINYDVDNKLLAGLNITIGAWVLQLNVRDQLQGFTELSHERR